MVSSPGIRGIFFRSESPGWSLLRTYSRGIPAPSAFPVIRKKRPDNRAAASPGSKSGRDGALSTVASEKPSCPFLLSYYDCPDSRGSRRSTKGTNHLDCHRTLSSFSCFSCFSWTALVRFEGIASLLHTKGTSCISAEYLLRTADFV